MKNGAPKGAPFSVLTLEAVGYALGLSEEVEIIGTAGLRVGSAHVEAAEGVRADHCSGALAIEVEIADVKFAACDIEAGLVAGVEGAGEAILGVIGYGQTFFKACYFDDGEDGSEDFFL